MKEKSFERKAELLKAALNEFTVKSYEDASLNTIIKNAGISKGTFYYHFQDKQALYLFLLSSTFDVKWEFMNSLMKEHTGNFEGKDIFERFKLQAKAGVEFAAAHPEYFRFGKMFVKEKGNKIYETAKGILGSSTETLIDDMIKKAVDDGDFRDSFTRDFIARVVNYLFMHFDEIFDTDEDFELGKMIENLNNYVDFMKFGMGK